MANNGLVTDNGRQVKQYELKEDIISEKANRIQQTTETRVSNSFVTQN